MFQDIKGVIKINTMAKRKRTKGQTTIYKILRIQLNIEEPEPHQKPGINSGAPEG